MAAVIYNNFSYRALVPRDDEKVEQKLSTIIIPLARSRAIIITFDTFLWQCLYQDYDRTLSLRAMFNLSLNTLFRISIVSALRTELPCLTRQLALDNRIRSD